MDRNKIYELLILISNMDEKGLREFYKSNLGIEYKKRTSELDEKIYYELAKKIEQGDFEYFISEFTKKREIFIVANILKYFLADKNEYKKQFLKENNIIGAEIFDLIKSIDDPDFTKEYIEIIKGRIFDQYLVRLIELTNDKDYIKKCLEEREKYGLNNVYCIMDLIVFIGEQDYIIGIFKNRKKYRIDSLGIIEIIQKLKDPIFVKQCIEKRNEYGIDSNYIVNLIRTFDNPDFEIECLKEYKQLNLDLDFIDSYIEKYPELFFEKFEDFLSIYKETEKYEDFLRKNLGEIDLIDNNPVIPSEIRKFFSGSIDSEYLEEFKNKLPEIIAKWRLIKKQIIYKKANNLLKDGLEVRFNVKEILSALHVLNKILPRNASENELYDMPEFESVGQDTKYTRNPETATERAYNLATKMDKNKARKKFPDFSIETGEISVKVLHPQDKSAILSGYKNNSCFRPNGDADNKAENEYSLLQYCTCTEYGGVVSFEDSDGDKIYMQTPILVNKNMFFFHSYETDNCEKTEKVSNALVESAKRIIEMTEGKIKIVFLGNLHRDRFVGNNKLIIKSFFRPYTENEYKDYEKMYGNFDKDNVVLAVKIGEKILSGKELMDFFNNECEGKEEVFINKVGLDFGEVEDSYDFPKRSVIQDINIEKSDLVEIFYKKYQEKEKEREELALIKEKKRLQSKKELSPEEEKELKIIEKELNENYEDSSYDELDLSEITSKLEICTEESLSIFSGNDIITIAKYYGITEEEINKKIEEEINREPEKQSNKVEKYSNNAKKVKNKIISQIKEKNNNELNTIIPKIIRETINDEELKELEEYGINTDAYVRLVINKEGKIDDTTSIENKKNNRIKQIKSNTRIMEKIVSEIIFENITEDEFSNQVINDTILEVKSEIFKYYQNELGNRKLSKEYKEKINNKIHDLKIEELLRDYTKTGEFDEEKLKRINMYGIDIKEIYKKYNNMPEIEKGKVRLNKLDKIKANISIGIRKIEKWKEIKRRISKDEKQTDGIVNHAIFGNSWYIEYINGSKPNIYLSENATEDEKNDFKLALKKQIEIIKSEKKEINISEIANMVSTVSLSDKNEVEKIIDSIIRGTERRSE